MPIEIGAKPQDVPQWILGPRKDGDYPAMPVNQVHIIAGSSGAGKTTLLFQMVKAIEAGEKFFGFPTARHPMLYITYDRGPEETNATMARAGISEDLLPVMALELGNPDRTPGGKSDHRFENDMQLIRNAHPEAKVIIIDGFYSLVPCGQINDYLTVAEWLQRVRRYCETHGLTIIGVAHSPKQREGARIIDPRQMIQGSVAGAGYTSCGIVVMREKPEGGNQNRTIYFLPRNSEEVKLQAGMDAKGLISQSAYQVSEGAGRPRNPLHDGFVELVYATWVPGQNFSLADLVQTAADLGVSRSNVSQWLSEMVTDGGVTRIRHGVYCVARGAHDARG